MKFKGGQTFEGLLKLHPHSTCSSVSGPEDREFWQAPESAMLDEGPALMFHLSQLPRPHKEP